MVYLKMDSAENQCRSVYNVAAQTSKRTKKSLRLSEKKEKVIKRTEEKEKERQRIQDEKKEKEEDNVAVDADEDETYSKTKQKRHREHWAKVDKNAFFEAIGEFGKDFDKICSFMEKKAKARAKSVKECESKNKDQIRYFYYRTWRQISKAITLQPCESKRLNHEIYCMICYGELRKKDVVGFGEKDLKKLDELVTNGSTTVRYRGRKVRLKTPTSKFLKKLSDDEEKSGREIESVPEMIDVELYPRSNKAWAAAQCNASNPRLRLPSLPITVKLRSLLKLLQKRFENASSDLLPDSSRIALHPPTELNKDSSTKKDDKKEPVKTKQLRTTTVNTGVACEANLDDIADLNTKSTAETPRLLPVSFQVNFQTDIQPVAACNALKSSDKSLSSKVSTASTTLQDSCSVEDSRNVPSNENTTSNDCQSTGEIEECQAESTDCSAVRDSSIFPITSDNVAEKDLQMCYLELRKPDKIRLEYDWQEKTQETQEIQNNNLSSLHKLAMLSQRDLEKMIRCQTTTQTKISLSSKTNATTKTFLSPKSYTLSRPQQSFKTRLVNANETSNTVQSIGLPSICFPALTNTVRPVIQRKVTPRLRKIQPASKTLMAKAVAVNIVPQPAQLVQFGKVPPVSAQLVNSGSASVVASSNHNVSSETSSVFSTPSTISLSSPITIWSSPLMSNEQNDQVQVEIIQEGSGNKTSVKRLHPTSVAISEEMAAKRSRVDPTENSPTPIPTDFSDVDLDFLASTASNDASRLSCISDSDGVNLSSILSGLTKNLRKNEETSVTVTQQTDTVVTTTAAPSSNPATTPSFTISSSVIVPAVTPKKQRSPSPPKTTECNTPSVLLTPVKNVTRTPSKNEGNLDSLREHPVSFGSHWFGEDMTEISLGGLLDVGNIKDHAKNSDSSSQASDVSIGNLLNVVEKKRDIDDQNTQGSDISISTLLGVSRKKSKDSEKSAERDSSPTKTFNSDSLLMKPEGDPVVAFESLMDENSIDYINKFKDLTAKFKANSDHSKNHNNTRAEQNQSNADSAASISSTHVKVSLASLKPKDPTLPVYRSEDSVGLLDDLSFVLPVDNNSSDSLKSFS